MAPRARPRRYGRVARPLVLSLFAIGVAACAAILGIDDREPVEGAQSNEAGDAPSAIDSATDGATEDGSIVDGGADVRDPTKQCNAATCGDAGGTCMNGSCALSCAGNCANKTFKCPDDTDCTIGCQAKDSCSAIKCVGGRSCTLDCAGAPSCKGGVSCTSERCEFRCVGGDACLDGVTCDASTCGIRCSGTNSCNGGVEANATESCSIACTGVPSCKSSVDLRCNSPDASIFCGLGMDVCKDGKPACFSDKCTIDCRDKSACSRGYCCDAGACVVSIEAGTANSCP